MKHLMTLLALCWTSFLFSQISQPPFTSAEARLKSFEVRKALRDNSLVANVPFRSIGPSIFSGRVADLDVSEKDPSHFYVAYASGGLWKTNNNGMSFSPLFDDEAVMSIGDIAVDWKRNVIWVGTGEVNSSRSSYSGVGIFKSEDGGKSWQNKGLGESHHIGRIILHPTDPNTLWVAALGHLYSPNPERGIYKTTDGGKTWQQTLFVSENAGAIDLVINPQDPDILYAATWERKRRAWNFWEAGSGSGIYKSTDGGDTWSLLTTEKSGFPAGEGVGRIGLALTIENGREVLFALLDNYFRRPKKEEEEEDKLTKDELRSMSKADFLKLDKDLVKDYLSSFRFPKKYTVEKVKAMVKKDEITPLTLVEYVEDANSLLFDTPVIGAEVYRSNDGGKTWKKTHPDYLDNVYNSYGYYFGQIRVSPQDADKLYIMGVPALRSDDGGATWKSINGDNVHGDHHALWVDPNREGHLILGNDGGINISYDDGEQWIKCNTPSVGQFYSVTVDMAKPFNVYGGLQDNGVWGGPSNSKENNRWQGTGRYPYQMILGGDGMQVAVDTRDNATVYTGFQFGNYYRVDKNTRKRQRITPKQELGQRPLRWNWQTPIWLSTHNQDILYMGSNKLHRSLNQGDDFEEISGDLTTGGKKGDVAFSTLTTIHESPMKFGLIYVGTDDGLVHVTKDGGHEWTKITDGLPEEMWVSRVQASQHQESRVYVALNGYRWDDFHPYLFVSEDYGQNWKQIGTDLPLEPVNVIKEDPVNPNLLYVGTDNGLYISLDRGASFMQMGKDLPATPIHDLVVHPRDKKLIVGTHGRSLYLANVTHVQQLVDSIVSKKLFAFDIEKVKYSSRWGNPFSPWRDVPEPEIEIPVFANSAGKIRLTLKAKDIVLKSWEEEIGKGLNYLTYKGDIEEAIIDDYASYLNGQKKEDEKEIKVKKAKNGKYYLLPGTYQLVMEKDGTTVESKLKVVRQK